MSHESAPALAGSEAEALLREVATWGKLTTVILHGGCVFEFKGSFPAGDIGMGFYNLDGRTSGGFEGHIRLDAIASIGFQDKLHRGRASYAFTFNNASGENLFKVFLGRDEQGEVFAAQLEKFNMIRDQLKVAA
ncbi:heme iron utilization protein [Halioglobus sp. HI00S01]|uniref:heme utilization cystosolic carrier protein HutX n=1 Tax=Halioglobus sp. HI00S01 TaxID=1822214 RepID=UPI0007C21D91|nr:heme utilization cystosolic carrier protein HutX [Halioglobus sp. HI00S01]KZX60520.1 heme iron utilization protein [Halioglobus sp. HI00S01]